MKSYSDSLRNSISNSLSNGNHQPTVLVVDDEPTARKSMRRTLARFGYNVLLAEDGLEGIEIYQEHAHDIDLVILDMSMPQMNGPDVFQAMRRIRADARILCTSGYTAKDAGLFLGCDQPPAFLLKPFLPQELMDKIKAVLD